MGDIPKTMRYFANQSLGHGTDRSDRKGEQVATAAETGSCRDHHRSAHWPPKADIVRMER